jgi:hypothetical protein
MSDDLQSGGIRADIGASGQSDGSTIAEATDTSTATPSTSTKPNWHNDPEYRKMQAERDRRDAAKDKEIQALRAQQEQLQLSGMDDLERTAYERDKAAKQADQLAQRLAQIEQDKVRTDDLQELSRKHNVPMDVLDKATDAMHARELVIEYKEQAKGQRAADVQAKETKNAGHLDRGSPSATGWEGQRNQAKKAGDAAAVLAAHYSRRNAT